METKLNNKRIAVVVADGFEESEFLIPLNALKEQSATVDVISLKPGKVKAWRETNWGGEYMVDKVIEEVNSDDYDALLLPGGVMSPDQLRMNEDVIDFVAGFMENKKPVAAICHGLLTLIETDMLAGRTLTSFPSIRTDLINAGADWVDEEVVCDQGFVTSRRPADLPAFCAKMIEEFAEGIRDRAKNPEVV